MTSLIHADEVGFFGNHGSRFLPPQLKAPITEVVAAYAQACQDLSFQAEYEVLLANYVGRPSPLSLTAGLTRHLGGVKIYLKREDLNRTGAYRINHCLGEGLLAKRMGKRRLIMEAGAGQYGVALVTAAALLGLECEIHTGTVDVAKQHSNMVRMEMLSAKVVSITSGGQTLKEAADSAFSVFAADYTDAFFTIGSAAGPDPYPSMVRNFQSTVGREARHQVSEKGGCLPDALMVVIGGDSNASGLFIAFLEDEPIKMFGVEPAGRNLEVPGQRAATITLGTPGALHGMRTLLLQDENDDPAEVHFIVSGLGYPGVGPQHAFLRDTGHVEYATASDDETIVASQLLCRTRGIIPALKSSHTLARAIRLTPMVSSDEVVVMNLSGRSDENVDYVTEYLAR